MIQGLRNCEIADLGIQNSSFLNPSILSWIYRDETYCWIRGPQPGSDF
jgi:hypothetical protein